MPRSLYRWKTFWFGLFIVLSLAWAWLDSHRYFSGVVWIDRGLLWSGDGHIGCSIYPDAPHAPVEITTTRIPLAGIELKNILGESLSTHAFPHWLLFEASLITWFLFLGWRTRRHRKWSDGL